MFLKSAAWNAVGNLVRQAALAVQEVGVRVLLPPAGVGAWELANLIRRVGNIWDLGFLGAAQRDLPALRGAGQPEEARDYRSTTFTAQLVTKVVVVCGVAVWAALRGAHYSGAQKMAITAALVMLVLTAVIETATIIFQTAECYAPLSRVTMGASIVGSAATLVGTWRWGVAGLLVGSALGLALYAALLVRALAPSALDVTWGIRTDLFRRMAAFAVPLKAVDYPNGLMTELDSIVVSRFFGLGPLAIYATAKTLVTQAVQITSWLALVLVMRINTLGVQDAERRRLSPEIRRYLLVVDLVLLPLLVTALSLLAPPLIVRFIPAYRDATRLVPFLLLTMYFVPQTTVIRNLWILDRRLAPLATSNVIGLAACGGGIGAAVLLRGMELPAIAMGYLAGHVIYYSWIMATVGRETFGVKGVADVAGHAFASSAYVAAALSLTWAADPAEVGTYLLSGGIALLVLLPLLGYGLWRSELVDYAATALGLGFLPLHSGTRTRR